MKRLFLCAIFLCATAHAQVNLDTTIPAPQVKGTLQPANGGLGCTGVNCYYNLPRARTALDNVRHGLGDFRVLYAGDSTTWGTNSSSNTADLISHNEPSDVCADAIKNYGVPCQTDSWFGTGNTGSTSYALNDPRISAGSSWALDSTAFSVGGYTWTATTTTNGFCFTPTKPVDTFEVYYLQRAAGGIMNVIIDGGSPTAINTSGANALIEQTITTTLGTHTICHQLSSGTQVSIQGDVARNSTISSVIVMLAGMGGSESADWASTAQPWSPGNASVYATTHPDLVDYEMGINDWQQGVSPTTFATNMQTTVAAIISTGANVTLRAPNPTITTSASQAQQAAIIAEIASVAAANTEPGTSSKVPFEDVFDSWISYTAANANGWFGVDGVHPTQSGYANIAHIDESFIFGIPNVTGSLASVDWALAANAGVGPTPTVTLPYTVQCTESAVYVNSGSGGTLTLPTTCNAPYKVTVVEYTSTAGPVTFSGPIGAGMPTKMFAGSSFTWQFLGGNWWVVASSGPAQGIQLIATVTTTNYTIAGTEGAVLVEAGTLTFPALNTATFNGFKTTIANYGSTVTTSVAGTNHGIPASLPGSSSIDVMYYNGWYCTAIQGIPVPASTLNLPPTLVTGSYTATGLESAIYANNAAISLPLVTPANGQVTIPVFNYGSGATTFAVTGGAVNFGIPASIPSHQSIWISYLSGNWYLIPGQAQATSLLLNPSLESASYQITGVEGLIFMNATSPTLTFTNLGAAFNGFVTTIYNYGTTATVTVTGATNQNLPATMPLNSAITVSYENGTWWMFSSTGLGTTAANLAGGVANDIPFQTGAGATSFIAPVNSAVLVTSAGGVPSESTTLPSGITLVAPALGTPASGVATNLTGTAAGLTAGLAQGLTGTPSIGVGAVTAINVTASGAVSSAGFYIDLSTGKTTVAMGAQTTATPTNITGMSWTTVNSKNYLLRCDIFVSFSASATIAFALANSSGNAATSYNLDAQGGIGAAGVWQELKVASGTTAFGTATTTSGAPGSVTNLDIKVDAMIQNASNSGGTMTLQTIANGTNNFTVQANSFCTLTQIN
jgi:hypothetical protein